MKFTDRLMELRKKIGWSQEDLGYRIDVSRQTISKWENGETTPDMFKLMKLSEVFGITLDELMKGEVETKETSTKETNNKEQNNDEQNNNDVNDNEKSGEHHKYYEYPITFARNNKRFFTKANIIKVVAAIICILIAVYLIVCAYRFSILKDINDKFNAVKNEDNYYYERSEMYVDGNNMHLISKTRYWYKDGKLKKITETYDNGLKISYKYINFNKNEEYVINELDKTGTKMKITFDKEFIKNTIYNNYYESNIKIIKDSLNILNVKTYRNKQMYIIENNLKSYNKVEYDRNSGILQKEYRIDENNDENTITHKLEFNVVTDEDIQMPNLSEYTIKEVSP